MFIVQRLAQSYLILSYLPNQAHVLTHESASTCSSVGCPLLIVPVCETVRYRGCIQDSTVSVQLVFQCWPLVCGQNIKLCWT